MSFVRVAVVEDDHLQRESIVEVLGDEHPRAEVVEYGTALEAIDAVQAGSMDQCDLVVLDRMLIWSRLEDPRLKDPSPLSWERGDAVLEELSVRSQTSSIPVVVLSIYQGPINVRRAVTPIVVEKTTDLAEFRQLVSNPPFAA